MSSKIEIEKNCEYCGKLFTARTIYTRYCTLACNRRGYKAIKRQEKIDNHKSIADDRKKANYASSIKIADIRDKDFLSISETCTLIGVSRNTIFRWIKNELLTSYQHGTKHLIKKTDINKIFNNGKEQKESSPKAKSNGKAA